MELQSNEVLEKSKGKLQPILTFDVLIMVE